MDQKHQNIAKKMSGHFTCGHFTQFGVLFILTSGKLRHFPISIFQAIKLNHLKYTNQLEVCYG